MATPSATALVSRTRPLAGPRDPLAALAPGGFACVRNGAGLATAGVAARIPVGTGPGRISRAAEEAADVLAGIVTDDPLTLPGTGPIAVGALPFADEAPGELVVPAVVVGCGPDGRAWITQTGPSQTTHDARPSQNGPTELQTAHSGHGVDEPQGVVVDQADGRSAWTSKIRQALDLIGEGTVTKVVLARQLRLTADRPFDVRSIVARLRSSHPSCWTYADGSFVGASPELLVRRRGDRVESTPMAGTVPQGASSVDDERLVALLESSAKERAEHAVVVDEVVAGLEPVCEDVVALAEPEVVRLATVAHLATMVAGRLRQPQLSALALAGLLHPTPAVAGIPRRAALAAIAAMEDFDRGLYAGPVGWVDARGDGEWVVALRGAQVEANRAVLTAGAGIVCDSDADAEWRETQAKLEAMLGALAPAR